MVSVDGNDSGFEIHCDVPGCPVAHLIVSSLVATTKGHVTWSTRVDLARQAAEQEGWFFEVMHSKHGVTLIRDICPRQAPAYRTMLAAVVGRQAQQLMRVPGQS